MRVRAPERPEPQEQQKLWDDVERELLQRITDGADAVAALRGVKCVVAKFQDHALRAFKALPCSDYQDVDNYRLLVLKLKMMLMDELLGWLEHTVMDGQDAHAELAALQPGGEK